MKNKSNNSLMRKCWEFHSTKSLTLSLSLFASDLKNPKSDSIAEKHSWVSTFHEVNNFISLRIRKMNLLPLCRNINFLLFKMLACRRFLFLNAMFQVFIYKSFFWFLRLLGFHIIITLEVNLVLGSSQM